MGPELHDFQYNFSLIERIAEYVKYEYKILDCRNIIMFTSSDTIMTRRSTVLYQREMLAACQSNIIKSNHQNSSFVDMHQYAIAPEHYQIELSSTTNELL